MEQGWDPDVKKYFRKVLNSFFLGLLWLIVSATAGIYFKLAFRNEHPLVYTMLYYAGVVLSLVVLLRWYYITWNKKKAEKS